MSFAITQQSQKLDLYTPQFAFQRLRKKSSMMHMAFGNLNYTVRNN